MTDLSPETVGKLVAFVRELAPYSKRAEMLAAELPEPVDPDHAEAVAVLDSFGDAMPGAVALALAAIKRGRALAAGDRS